MNCYAILYIIRGLPGSGKSTLAQKLVSGHRHREADMFHMTSRGYFWRKENVRRAHDWCFGEVLKLMRTETADIAVSNTFTRKLEYEKYLELADAHGYKPVVIECHADLGNVHMVPAETIKDMRERYEPHCVV